MLVVSRLGGGGGAAVPPRQVVSKARRATIYIPQRGVQWKQGVVIYMMLCISLSYDTTPIHCTPLPLHPPM